MEMIRRNYGNMDQYRPMSCHVALEFINLQIINHRPAYQSPTGGAGVSDGMRIKVGNRETAHINKCSDRSMGM